MRIKNIRQVGDYTILWECKKYTWKTKIIILENNTKIYQEAYFIQADENIKYAISKD